MEEEGIERKNIDVDGEENKNSNGTAGKGSCGKQKKREMSTEKGGEEKSSNKTENEKDGVSGDLTPGKKTHFPAPTQNGANKQKDRCYFFSLTSSAIKEGGRTAASWYQIGVCTGLRIPHI